MEKPLVGIVLGSASDLPVARKAAETLAELDIPYEVTVASAHRTPEDVANYASNAEARGIEVLLAIAGLSAALPGAIAAQTRLPVIGIPVPAGTLGGIDALLSIAQMPPGVPVAAMGIDSARNGALFAARILALTHGEIAVKLSEVTEQGKEKVVSSREKLDDLPTAPREAFKNPK